MQNCRYRRQRPVARDAKQHIGTACDGILTGTFGNVGNGSIDCGSCLGSFDGGAGHDTFLGGSRSDLLGDGLGGLCL